MKRAVAFVIIVCLSLVLAGPLFGAEKKKGKLESFEGELDKPTTTTTTSVSGGDVAAQSLMGLFSSFLLTGLTAGEYEGTGDLYTELKMTESPALPTFKVDASYQFVIDDVHGAIGRIEAGYLSFAADFEFIRYFEKQASDLDILSGHFLLRTLFARFLGANLALGVKSIWGANKHTGFEFGFPLYIFFTKHLILDVMPYFAYVNGNRVYDMAGGFSVKWKAVGARAYYRAIHTGSSTLHGPGIGLFIQW